MLDRWIHNATKPSPEKRARQQLKAIRDQTRRTLAAMYQVYPDSNRSNELLHQHQQRVQTIIQPRRMKQPKYVRACDICGRPTNQSAELWTDSLVIKCLYSLAVAGLFVLLAFLAEWWALFLFPIGWVVSQSFLWTITVPFSLLLIFILFMSMFGM
jgi:hypothetical protein